MAKDKQLPEPGTYTLPKDGGEPVSVAPIPGLESAQAKMDEGAKLHELDDLDRQKIQRKAYLDDDARIKAAASAEQAPEEPVIDKDYGIFGDLGTKFLLLHEQVGPFNRNIHKTVTYKDLCQFQATGNFKDGFEANYGKADVLATKASVDRLINLGAIRPLVLVGA